MRFTPEQIEKLRQLKMKIVAKDNFDVAHLGPYEISTNQSMKDFTALISFQDYGDAGGFSSQCFEDVIKFLIEQGIKEFPETE